ncbi:MAG: LysR family transcriptional regulator [Rhodoferax sp.]
MKKNVFDTMDLNLLRVLAMLMLEGNVTRAAEKLHLTQSAVSNALKRLRLTFDDSLFERTAYGMQPTATGRDLWQRLAPLYRAIGQELNPDAIDPAHYQGAFKIAMSDYTSARVMPRLAVYLQTHAPGVRVHAAPYSVINLLHHLEREGADLALGTNLDDTRQMQELRTQALWPIHSSLFMRRGHPLARGTLTLNRFLEARHVDVMLPGMTSTIYDSLLAEHGHTRNLVLTMNQYNHVLSLIAHSDYVGVLPTSLIDLCPERRRLVHCEPPIPIAVRSLVMTWHQRNDARPAHLWLRDAIAGLFTASPPPFDRSASSARSARQATPRTATSR